MSYPIETVRHSLAHVMAAAVKKLYPDVKFAGGPAIENGFYYDFDTEHRFSEDDFPKIEREMRDLIKSNGRFEQRNVSLDEAKEIFANQPYKMEWLNEYDAAGAALSIYTFRDFVDLCRGPHVESSKDLPRDAFKIRSVAGAYWKGDAKNKMLQRIYVDAFATKDELDAFLKMQEEAAARDNRKLGKDMDLFHFEPDYAPGAVFWHDKGFKIYRKLIEYIRHRQERAGYLEISTPSVMDRSLWERSGHWAKYGEHNYSGKTQDGKTFCVKPMSCPGGMLVFGQGIKSYKDLPMYLAEFGKVNRYEAAGGLSGLMRVREFTQDDAHIFCTEEQLEEEVVKILRFIKDIYGKFGFDKISMKLATRKESEFRIGSDEIWDKAEGALKHALDANGIEYEIAPGDAAFYGPKIDNYLKDALGRTWQCGTVQLDMNLPERFDLSYIGEDGEKHRPIMLHRAMLGSIERFMGILLESTGGNLPLWLSPEPVVVAPISEKFRDYALEIVDRLRDAGVWARADLRDEKVNYKIRELSLAKTPIIGVVGEKEMADNTITLRKLGVEKQETIALDKFIADMKDAVKMPA
ncbi:MAG: threonine--tRNA ligase [Proteobacteria bacterium]|uniref:Threonine--tRNA ligase n=1 Tax=Candidatus Enterousia avistercoris TaxID=2840788 RepID=A0A9D9DDL6_9PROT|nr:threonine--tRNA ligase [Candidatus Enterousia avistercoris]